jgi:pimeloyl-ACP methyl ester carboxylesterase
LVHGWESNASRWENLLPYLKKSGSTIAIDGPAHGLSSGKEFTQNMQNSFILLSKIQTSVFRPFTWWKTCLYYQSVYQSDALKW